VAVAVVGVVAAPVPASGASAASDCDPWPVIDVGGVVVGVMDGGLCVSQSVEVA
jgi:hypothetical protein